MPAELTSPVLSMTLPVTAHPMDADIDHEQAE